VRICRALRGVRRTGSDEEEAGIDARTEASAFGRIAEIEETAAAIAASITCRRAA